jgi:hypothetical protein
VRRTVNTIPKSLSGTDLDMSIRNPSALHRKRKKGGTVRCPPVKRNELDNGQTFVYTCFAAAVV